MYIVVSIVQYESIHYYLSTESVLLHVYMFNVES